MSIPECIGQHNHATTPPAMPSAAGTRVLAGDRVRADAAASRCARARTGALRWPAPVPAPAPALRAAVATVPAPCFALLQPTQWIPARSIAWLEAKRAQRYR
ncbi:hypothetical protein Vqi01_00130 [Micromonospora qiuiae]|uniref:Uncharacterized protein n=1 Tax=Micromonospora qiuiae TaxID=502268 RepID=A0ABQ4J3V4_9ACTN|nr:hypothetical protein Vqi01_00130 [Micromonospora qiuiae]